MNILVEIKRQISPSEKPYIECFSYSGDGKLSVSDYLTELNTSDIITNAEGQKTRPVIWECSCNEKKCGSCSMLINGYPTLACSVFLCDLAKKGKITLAPLSKFPLVCDLKVDRKSMFQILEDMHIWQSEEDEPRDKGYSLQREAGKCIMCGCCLEVCPNFLSGTKFGGASALVNAYRAMAHNQDISRLNELKQEYMRHFYAGCGQALSCVKACPVGIALDRIQSRANILSKKE